jgi:hypothetical protein
VETWTPEQLLLLHDMEELLLVITREGRAVLHLPVWPVTVGEHAYVRSYRGTTSAWYRGVMAERNQAVAFEVDADAPVPVFFESVAPDLEVNTEISSEYLRKYATAEYRDAMVTDVAIDATLRILPR